MAGNILKQALPGRKNSAAEAEGGQNAKRPLDEVSQCSLQGNSSPHLENRFLSHSRQIARVAIMAAPRPNLGVRRNSAMLEFVRLHADRCSAGSQTRRMRGWGCFILRVETKGGMESGFPASGTLVVRGFQGIRVSTVEAMEPSVQVLV